MADTDSNVANPMPQQQWALSTWDTEGGAGHDVLAAVSWRPLEDGTGAKRSWHAFPSPQMKRLANRRPIPSRHPFLRRHQCLPCRPCVNHLLGLHPHKRRRGRSLLLVHPRVAARVTRWQSEGPPGAPRR